MQSLTITRIYTTDKDKNGNPLMSKQGKPYTRMSIQTQEYGEKWLSGFKNQTSGSWKVGEKVDVIVKESGQYLNFETPKKEGIADEKLEKILNALTGINLKLSAIFDHVVPAQKAKIAGTDIDYPEDDIDPEDIPF